MWGNFLDLGLTASAVSLGDDGRPQPVPVGSFTVDRSVHGVLTWGPVAEMVDTRYQGLAGVWIYRGGSWADRDARRFTTTGRRGIDERAVLPHVGFRLA